MPAPIAWELEQQFLKEGLQQSRRDEEGVQEFLISLSRRLRRWDLFESSQRLQILRTFRDPIAEIYAEILKLDEGDKVPWYLLLIADDRYVSLTGFQRFWDAMTAKWVEALPGTPESQLTINLTAILLRQKSGFTGNAA